MTRALALAVLIILLSASVASAQGIGFVAGGTIDPEQFYAGTFFETPPLGPPIHIRPGIDGSWGQGLRIAAINIDIITRAPIGSGWQFYTGGGPTISIVRFSDNGIPGAGSNNEVTGGFTALFGFIHPKGFLLEVRYGSAAGGPSLKFGAGFQVGKRR
jgi:hypothetical protein